VIDNAGLLSRCNVSSIDKRLKTSSTVVRCGSIARDVEAQLDCFTHDAVMGGCQRHRLRRWSR
jgi:hypothetical protein